MTVPRQWLRGAVFASATVLAAAQTPPAKAAPDHQLHLRCGTFDPLRAPPKFDGLLAAPAGTRLWIVQFHDAIQPWFGDALRNTGVEVIAYLPQNAWLVRANSVGAQPWIRSITALPVGARLEEPLLAVVAGAAAAAPQAREYRLVLARKSDRARLLLQVEDGGGVVTNRNDGSTFLLAKLTPLQLARVAAQDTVVWVELATPIGVDMDNVRIQTGANAVEAAGGLTGSGMRVEITEGLDATHPDWTLPPLVRNDSLEAHGHCTAMVVAGNGAGNPAARGLLPDAQVIENSVFAWGASSRHAITAGSVDPAQPWRVMQQTASWGHQVVLDYTAISQELDDVLFDFDLPATQSQGNQAGPYSRPEAWAKNVIAVGGVHHFDNAFPGDDQWAASSTGPARDGRIKPDLCAFDDSILCGDLVGTAGFSLTDYYANFGGTSASSPIVNGCLGLAQQMFTDGLFGNPLPLPATAANRFGNRPHMSTAKALLINTAASYPFSGAGDNLARMHQGFGVPDLARLWQHREQLVAIDEYDVLGAGQSRTYYVWVPPGTAEFRATMVYADPPALPNATIHRVNSVDLRVTRWSDGLAWWGNNGLDVGNASTPGGIANDLDTTENVWLPGPVPGIYKVEVRAAAIALDGHAETPQLDVDYALVMHPVGGFRGDSTMTLDLVSAAPGDLRAVVGGAPAAGWTDGYTFFSLDTGGPAGFGRFFGVEPDYITSGIGMLSPAAGDGLRFTNAGATQFPFTTATYPPSVVLGLHGVTLDAMVTLVAANGAIVAQSNVDRVTVQ